MGVVIGRDRRIWIGLRAVAAGNPWLVLDDEARLAGQLTLPLGNTLEAANASHIWAIEQDSMDVESVICYRLSAGSGS